MNYIVKSKSIHSQFINVFHMNEWNSLSIDSRFTNDSYIHFIVLAYTTSKFLIIPTFFHIHFRVIIYCNSHRFHILLHSLNSYFLRFLRFDVFSIHTFTFFNSYFYVYVRFFDSYVFVNSGSIHCLIHKVTELVWNSIKTFFKWYHEFVTFPRA